MNEAVNRLQGFIDTSMTTDLQPTAENQWTISPSKPPDDAMEKVCRLLELVTYCSLSTCSVDGQPWVSPVFFAFDAALNIYWSSAIASRHSQNLYTNQGKAAITLYKSQKSEGPTDGLYLSGTATELDLSGVQQAFPLLEKRAGSPIPRSQADYLGESARRMYHFVPQQMWCTGERLLHGNQLMDTKISIDIETFIASLSSRL